MDCHYLIPGQERQDARRHVFRRLEVQVVGSFEPAEGGVRNGLEALLLRRAEGDSFIAPNDEDGTGNFREECLDMCFGEAKPRPKSEARVMSEGDS